MANQGLSNDKLAELRKQREQARAQKKLEEEQKKAEAAAKEAVKPEAEKVEPVQPEIAEDPIKEEPKSEPVKVESAKPEKEEISEPVTPLADEPVRKRSAEKKDPKVYESSVKVVADDEIIIENEQENPEEEDGKVQVGFTMVDKSLVSEAKGNKRYGIKERGPLFKKLNNIVFYAAIPLMIVWTILAFGGICTSKVGHTSFGNNIYHKVKDVTVDDYTSGIVAVKAADLDDLKKNDIICVEIINRETAKKELHLIRVVEPVTHDIGASPVVIVAYDNDNDTLTSYRYSKNQNFQLNTNITKFVGIVSGKDFILGPFLMFAQNIVVFIFLVAVPAFIILGFQFINLYDSIRIYVKQRKIKANTKQVKKEVEARDKIRR